MNKIFKQDYKSICKNCKPFHCEKAKVKCVNCGFFEPKEYNLNSISTVGPDMRSANAVSQIDILKNDIKSIHKEMEEIRKLIEEAQNGN